jgi:hypothetical protein
MTKKTALTLYPRLVPCVALDYLGEEETQVLGALSEKDMPKNDGTIEAVMSPSVSKIGRGGYLINDTGCDFAKPFGKLILQKWKQEGAGEKIIGVLKAAQKQNCKQVVFSADGMWPEPRKPVRLEKLGKKTPNAKSVRKMLESLILMHKDLWPIEQLANVLNPCLKKTRKK